jgi:hypothetical protein
MGYFSRGALIERIESVVTSNGTTTLTASSKTFQRFTGTLGQAVKLPAAAGCAQGQQFTILNRSSGAISVSTNSNTFLVTIAAGYERTFRLADVANELWDVTAGAQAGGGAAVASDTGVGRRPADGFRTMAWDKFSVAATDPTSKVIAAATNAAYTSGTDANYRLQCAKGLSVTLTGGAYVLSAAPSFTLAPGDVIVPLATNRPYRIATVTGPTTGTIDTTVSAGSAACMVSQAVWTKNLPYQGNAAQLTRLIDLYPSLSTALIHIEYADSIASGDTFPDYTTAAAIAVAICGQNTNTVPSTDVPLSANLSTVFQRPAGLLTTWPDAGVASATHDLNLCFFCSPTNASVTTGANLLGYECSLIPRALSNNGGYVESAFAHVGTSNINCSVPTSPAGGPTTWILQFPYLPGVNPGRTKGDITVTFNGLVVPRFITGMSTAILSFTEPSPYTLLLSQDVTAAGNRLEAWRTNSVIDHSTTNAARIALLWDAIVGTAAQVAAGVATHSDFATAYAALPANSSILLLKSYVPTSTALTLNKSGMSIIGQGRGSTLSSGAVSITSTYHEISGVRFGGNVTLSAAAIGNHLRGWQATGFTVTNSGTANAIVIIQE